MNRVRSVSLAACGAIVLAWGALAAQSSAVAPATRDAVAEKFSGDLLPAPAALGSGLRASNAPAPRVVAAAGPTVDEVSDVDSFSRSLTWLGLMQGNLTLTHSGCPTPADPTTRCIELNPAGAPTAFALDDIARMTLPAKSTNSLLCHWFSPVLLLNYQNPGATSVVARVSYTPTLTLENEVLNDPSLIDLSTGLPFGGSLRTAMTASERIETPLAPGMVLNQRERDTAACIAGFISKRALIETYGLTDAQARQFFKKKTVIRMNVSGSMQYVEEANLVLGLRVIGD